MRINEKDSWMQPNVIMLSITELQPNVNIIWNNQPFVVISSLHVKMGRGSGIQQVRMRSLVDGTIINQNFKGNDKIQPADLGRRIAQLLYQENELVFFMDSQNFDQFSLEKNKINPGIKLIPEGTSLEITYFNNRPIGVTLPIKVKVKVAFAEPGLKGDRSSAGTKSVTLATGAQIQAPLFIKTDDEIIVDTRTSTYVERAKSVNSSQ